MSSIINFLKTGKLGALEIGITKQSVEEYLGIPEAISYNKSFVILKYGDIQLSFYKGIENDEEEYILKHIHIDFDDSIRFPHILNISGWCPTSDTNYAKFIEETKKYGVTLHEDKQHTYKGIQLGLKSVSGVIAIFDDEDYENRIVSMSLFEFF
ncbi:MAG: hypothetical protein BWY74_01990 [Firmicutes bacterium ADurb.Bin419]|nr:MAG: hypothetical protein BWY74_01990 [Firmicutes bacterium ADurb.Bin419]